jgi:23S rRNA pseudouridine2605 synthase
VLAAAGVASRRECEALILDGRVEVDRETVTELGTRVDPMRQEIRVDGAPLGRRRHVYYLVNKPVGVVCTNRDPDRRTRVIDLVPDESRLFTIGRLDRSSEGLILVTNDGDLANMLAHPRYGVPKTYRATVVGCPTAETLKRLRGGVHLAEGVARVAAIRTRGRHARGAELELVLSEGRNREVRRILAKVGHKVLQLRRIAFGPIRLGNLPSGEVRRLTGAELHQLRACVRLARKQGGGAERAGTGKESGRPAKRTVRLRQKDQVPSKTKAQRSKTRPGKGSAPITPKGRPKPGQARSRQGAVLDYDASSSSRSGRPTRQKPRGKGRRS